MSCPICEAIVDRPDVPHCVRTCKACGRVMMVSEPGEGGKGVRVEEGDRFVIPKGWLRLSADPRKTCAWFTPLGLDWYMKMIYLDSISSKREEFACELGRLKDDCDTKLDAWAALHSFDLTDPVSGVAALDFLKANQELPEWWVALEGTFISVAQQAIEACDAQQAAWAVACAERCRSFLIYTEHLRDVVWMGQSAKRLIDTLTIWDANKENGDERFWQEIFVERSYVLSQTLSVPVVFIKDGAYVGGMSVDRKDAKFIDYILAGQISRDAILIEIKTPLTKLLGAKYRGTFPPSPELAGAVVQLTEYRGSVIQNLRSILSGTGHDVEAFSPRCLLIAGNSESELQDAARRKAFELFRGELNGIEIVTYDELFAKMDALASLFGLTRTKTTAASDRTGLGDASATGTPT